MGENINSRNMWFCGSIIPDNQAMISVLSPTAQFGLNVFEGVRCYWNEEGSKLYVFRLEEHLVRLFESCMLIGIIPPYDKDCIREAIKEVCRANSYKCDIALRITIFVSGDEGSWSSSSPTDMFIAPIRRPRNTLTDDSGRAACISTWERITDACFPPRVKAGANYLNGRYAHLEAVRNGYDYPIFLGRNRKVSEGAGACIFMVKKGVLVTPTVTSSILESITRDTLITLAGVLELEVDVREIDRTELYLAEEVFFCGSAAEITPITSIDRIIIGEGKVGWVTKRLSSLYFDIADCSSKNDRHWSIPVEKL